MEENTQIEEIITEGAEDVIRDDVYRLEELSDEMKLSIDNVADLITKQEYLANTLETLNDENFAQLLNGIKSEVISLKSQQSVMSARYDNIVAVCDMCRNDDKVRDAINLLLSGLKVFPDEE